MILRVSDDSKATRSKCKTLVHPSTKQPDSRTHLSTLKVKEEKNSANLPLAE